MAASDRPVPAIPALDGEGWYITGYPDLGELAYDSDHEVVDHAIWQANDGRWRVWACVRGTRIGRLFYGWEGERIDHPCWRPIGVTLRADRASGESLNDWFGEEWIQAPFVLHRDDGYFMFYGGHNSELGECQICLATSRDGINFQRHRDARGYSRVFIGPGEARDPMVLRVGEEWVLYYCAHDSGKRRPCKVFARTSRDLLNWSEPREVSWGGQASGAGFWSTECPFVLHRDGFYYLFRTSEYAPLARTHVYRSLDPFDFGLGDDSKLVTTLRVAAPEIVRVGEQDYISSVEDLKGGIQLFRLKWL